MSDRLVLEKTSVVTRMGMAGKRMEALRRRKYEPVTRSIILDSVAWYCQGIAR